MAKTKEEQRRRVLEFQHFNLTKFKLTNDGVTITHHENFNEPFEQTTNCEYQPHPDLIKQVDRLKYFMASSLGLLKGWDFAREHLKTNPNYLTKAKQGHDKTVELMKPSGFQFTGSGETAGVMITGSIKNEEGGSSGITCPKMTFGSDKYGFEDEVESICLDIKKELYAYRFQSKKAQLDIETEIKKQEQPELFQRPELNDGEFDEVEEMAKSE